MTAPRYAGCQNAQREKKKTATTTTTTKKTFKTNPTERKRCHCAGTRVCDLVDTRLPLSLDVRTSHIGGFTGKIFEFTVLFCFFLPLLLWTCRCARCLVSLRVWRGRGGGLLLPCAGIGINQRISPTRAHMHTCTHAHTQTIPLLSLRLSLSPSLSLSLSRHRPVPAISVGHVES